MKYIMVIFIGCFTMIACRKNGDLSSLRNGDKSKLIAMSNDSLGGWDLIYVGNSVTRMQPDSGLVPYGNYSEGQFNFFDSIQYLNTDSFQYVEITMLSDSFHEAIADTSHNVTTYTLTPSKLPLRVDYSYSADGIEKKSSGPRFFYHLNSNILDSVTLVAYNVPIFFTFTYNNQNITKITESQVYNNQKMELGTYGFTYSTTPNIFRQTDSLLYIYTYPQTAFTQPMVIAAFFAETFSAATFNSVTVTGILGEAYGNSDVISSNMSYSLNGDGEITEELFDNNIFEIAGKKYYYK